MKIKRTKAVKQLKDTVQVIPPKTCDDREELFCQRYLLHFNQSKAAREAGYVDANNSGGGRCAQKGWEVSRRPHVRDRLDELIRLRYTRLEIEQDDVVKRWQAIAFFDVSVLYDEDEQFVGIHNLPPEHRIIIKSVRTKIVRTGVNDYEERTIIELHSQQDAMNNLALHLGMLRQQVDVNHNSKTELTLKVQELRKLGTNRLLEIQGQISEASESF